METILACLTLTVGALLLLAHLYDLRVPGSTYREFRALTASRERFERYACTLSLVALVLPHGYVVGALGLMMWVVLGVLKERSETCRSHHRE